MIVNNLSTIMAIRNIKATRIYAETGISRSTLSSLANNSTKMIQLDTINTLCKYFSITPNEFFSYTPYEFEAKSVINSGKFNIESNGKYEQVDINPAIEGDLYVKAINGFIDEKVFELEFNATMKTPNIYLKDNIKNQFIDITISKSNDFDNLSNFILNNNFISFALEISKTIDTALQNEVLKKFVSDTKRKNIEDITTEKKLLINVDESGLIFPF